VAKKTRDYPIPFRGKYMMEWTSGRPGGALHVPGTYSGLPTEWRANTPFVATLKIDGHWRARSAARIGVTNVENGESYSMGLAGFYDAVIAYGVTAGGEITGRWAFRKQGANYGLIALPEVDDAAPVDPS
jgi:hypothetical protein